MPVIVRGTLTPVALARILRGLALSRKDGILHLQREGASKRIYLKRGAIVFAGSDDEHERLGEVLVRAGRLKPSDLDLALKVMKETGERLGRTLVDLGAVSEADVSALALERTKSIVRSLFCWASGTFYFEERDTGLGDDMAVELATADLILEAALRIEDLELVRRGLGDEKRVLRRSANPILPVEEGACTNFEWLLDRVNGTSTIEEIAACSPVDEGETLRAIHALLLAGVLEIEGSQEGTTGRTEPTHAALPAVKPTAQLRLGRYEVDRVLGRGAMGAVYLARDPTIDRTVAIKLIQTAQQLTPEELEKYRERFYREAKAAGKLLHPGIVTVFDVGHTEDATPFLVMEYVEGKTLQQILKTDELGHGDVVRIGMKILEPLAYAHSHGIVHRDIKPGNILVTPAGAVKVMDFGIAHVVGSELTQENDVLGSPNYMAPEQLSKGKIDARTDLFAFGVLLYRMLTGKLPFTGDSFAAIAKSVLFDEPLSPSSVNRAVPEALSRIVLRSMAKEPDLRFASAHELEEALASIATGGRASPKLGQPGGSLPSRSRRIGVAVAVGLGLALLSAFSLSRRWPAPVPPPGSPRVVETPNAAEGRSEAELYHEASLAFEEGDLDASKAALEALVRRNPGFEGAPELLVRVNERLREEEPSSAAPEPVAPAAPPLEAQLLYEASLAFERGNLEESQRRLVALLRANPSLEGATELLVRVNDEIWKKSLPITSPAKHNHRIGSCTGTLTLAAWGVGYASNDHEWKWRFHEIRLIERDGRSVLNLETHESDALSLGKPKNYKFELQVPLRDEDWARYARLTR